MTTDPQTDQQLDEVEARAAHLFEYATMPTEADQLAGVDVPALVAEVRRLRAAITLPSIHANDVQGFCPACGHGVLMLGEGGHVVCTLIDCPDPDAVDKQLTRTDAAPAETALRDRIAEALLTTHHREHGYHANCVVCAGDVNGLAVAALAVLRGLTLRELELLHRPNTTPSRPKRPCPAQEPLDGAQCSKEAGHEVHSDRPGRIWYPVADGETPAGEAYRLAVSTALRLGTGATWEAIHDRAEDLTAEVEGLTEARATNRRLNLRAQKLESELAAYRKAVADWKISDTGAYVPLRTLAAIAKAAGVAVPDGWELHYERVERLEAAEVEVEGMRERHKASLRHADKVNNELIEEVQRYAIGAERPVLWSVYNQMHLRAIKTETTLERAQKVARRLAAHAVGFKDVLDASDHGPWGTTVGADIAELIEALSDLPAVVPAGAGEEPADETRGAWGTRPACKCKHPIDEHSVYGCADGCGCEWMPRRKPMDPVHILGIKANDETQRPTPCGPVSDECDAEAGELCAVHEREEAHAEGEHCFCGSECDKACTCGSAGDAFVPIGHYADCPQATEPAPAVPQCDGCGHLVHRARKCPAVRYGERCECDEPVTVSQLGKEH